MPDIFIPRDTTGWTSYLNQLDNTAVLRQFTLDYANKNQEQLKTFDNHQALYEYLKQQPLVDELAEYAASRGIKKRPNLMEISRKLIETELYAYIISHFFDKEGYYSILLKEDETLKKAVEVINNNIWKPEVYIQRQEIDDRVSVPTIGLQDIIKK